MTLTCTHNRQSRKQRGAQSKFEIYSRICPFGSGAGGYKMLKLIGIP